MDYSGRSTSAMDVSGKDQYMDSSSQRHHMNRASRRVTGSGYSDRQSSIEGIICPKRGLGKQITTEIAEDGIFRAAPVSGFKLPFLGKKKDMDASSSSRRTSS
jgi:hypothetical protein